MKNVMSRSLLTGLILVLLDHGAFAQTQCPDFHRFNCQGSSDKRFSQNGQSKSANVKVGTETELNIIIYGGQDYHISLCHDEKVLGENLAIRLVEKVRMPVESVEEVNSKEPVLDENGNKTGTTQEVTTKITKKLFEEVEKVIWDNTEHEMAQSLDFSCTSTKRIAIEVIAAGAESTGKNTKGEQFDIGCVGILIQHMATPEVGFEAP